MSCRRVFASHEKVRSLVDQFLAHWLGARRRSRCGSALLKGHHKAARSPYDEQLASEAAYFNDMELN
jgi:hypothetical protein